MTSAGFVTRHVIHDTVIERQGSREFITIKPYLRIVAGLATDLPDDADKLPPFNPFKLYSDTTPVGAGEAAADAPQSVSVNRRRYPRRASAARPTGSSSAPMRSMRSSPRRPRISPMPKARRRRARRRSQLGVLSARKRASASAPRDNTTVIHKSAEDADTADDGDDIDDDLFASGTQKELTVGQGDTLMSLFAKVDTEPSEAQAIIEALAPIFQIDDLKAGENVRFTLVPAPSDTGTMEPVKISIYAKGGDHLASVTRNRQGDFVATTEGTELKAPQTSTRATLYTSFYHAALQQHIPADTILKLLRVHSYDVDFKQKVKPGDTFEMFFDGGATTRPANCSTPR